MLFTKEKLHILEIAYESAVKNNKNSFLFENEEILTLYAKYMIEYLKMQFK